MKGISNILPSFTRTVLCVLCALGLSLGAYAQSRTATVNVKDVTVKELLKEAAHVLLELLLGGSFLGSFCQTVKELLKAIEAGSSYTFAYVDTDIDLAGKVSVTAKNEDIEAVLKKVLPGVKVEFKDQKILLSKKAPEARPKASGTVGPKIITGKVVDKSGQPVIGAMVIERGTNNGTGTDIDGNYELKVKSEDAVLDVSIIGYNSASAPDRIINVDIDMYKVRVRKW